MAVKGNKMTDKKPPKTDGVQGGGGTGGGGGGGSTFDGADFIPQSQSFNKSLGEVVGKFVTDLCMADATTRQANANMIVAMVTKDDGTPRPPIDFVATVNSGDDKNLIKTDISVPLVAIANTDAFLPEEATLTMDMNVSASSEDTEQLQAQAGGSGTASVGWGPFKASITVNASMSTSKESKRSSDYRSTTHAEVKMTRQPAPEGLSLILNSVQKTVEMGLKIQEQKALDAANKAAATVAPAPPTP